MNKSKNAVFLGDSQENLRGFPEEVKDHIGFSLHRVQQGLKPLGVTKILKGIKPATVEIISSHNKNTYRAVYTIKIGAVVYVLHCFQKKSKFGIKTPKPDIDLIKKRLQDAFELEQSNGE